MEDIIEPIPKTMEKFMGCTGKMVKPSVATVEALIRKIKKGHLVTILQLRDQIAKDFEVNTSCPAATLKALQVISNAEKAKNYWRVVKPKGELISKFPGGIEGHAKLLENEGWIIDYSKKVPTVKAYETKLSKFI